MKLMRAISMKPHSYAFAFGAHGLGRSLQWSCWRSRFLHCSTGFSSAFAPAVRRPNGS